MIDVPLPEDLFNEAVQTSFQIESPAEAINTQLKIVASLNANGYRDYARALLPKLLLRIRELEDLKEQAYLMRLFIRQQCEMKLLTDAVGTLALLDFDVDHKAVALCDLAVAQARSGELKQAMETAEAIEDLDDYELVLEAVGEGQIRQLRFNDAVQTAAKIEGGDLRSQLLQFIALEQWKAGHYDEALQTLRNVLAMARCLDDASLRDRVYARLVTAFTDIHKVVDALSSAKEIADPAIRIEAFCSIVVFLQESGNAVGGRTAATEATIAARRITDPFYRAQALERIGEVLYRIGDAVESKEIFRESLASIKMIRNTYSQTQMMTGFGVKLSLLGMSDVAKRVFRLAVALAQTIEGCIFQFLCLGNIIQAQADGDLVEEATNTLAVVEEIRDEQSPQEIDEGIFGRTCAVALGDMALALFRKNTEKARSRGTKRFHEGLERARRIADPLYRSTTLQFLAERLVSINREIETPLPSVDGPASGKAS